MPLPGCSCSSGVAATALLALLLLPAEYYVPNLGPKSIQSTQPRDTLLDPGFDSWFSFDFPPIDIFLTLLLIVLATVTYLCDWIQRKLMERRILKLNASLRGCVRRARSWETRQEQTQASVRLARAAAAEYELLLYLLLARRRPSARATSRTPGRLDKDIDDINYITKPDFPL